MTAEILTLNPPMTPMQEANLEVEQAQAEITMWNDMIQQAKSHGDWAAMRDLRAGRTAAQERWERAWERKRGLEDGG